MTRAYNSGGHCNFPMAAGSRVIQEHHCTKNVIFKSILYLFRLVQLKLKTLFFRGSLTQVFTSINTIVIHQGTFPLTVEEP